MTRASDRLLVAQALATCPCCMQTRLDTAFNMKTSVIVIAHAVQRRCACTHQPLRVRTWCCRACIRRSCASNELPAIHQQAKCRAPEGANGSWPSQCRGPAKTAGRAARLPPPAAKRLRQPLQASCGSCVDALHDSQSALEPAQVTSCVQNVELRLKSLQASAAHADSDVLSFDQEARPVRDSRRRLMNPCVDPRSWPAPEGRCL